MDLYRAVELTLYSLIRIVPNIPLMLFLFKNSLRFNKWITAIGVVLLVAARVTCGIYAYFDEQRAIERNPGLLWYVLFCFLFIKAQLGKSLFNLLMLANINSFIVVAAKSTEGLIFPALAGQLHRWSNVLTIAVVSCIVLIPLFFYLKLVFKQAVEKKVTKQVWRMLWIVPFTFYCVWYRSAYYSAEGYNVLALRPLHTVYCLLINAGSMVIYTIVARLVLRNAEIIHLREREHELSLQHAQYNQLQDRIKENRMAKHDIRQHLHVISAYLRDKKYDDLEVYVSRYSKTVPEDTYITFCENYAANTLLQYYNGYAKMTGVGFSAEVTLPNDFGIAAEDLTVLLGNLLENATEACLASGGVISVRNKLEETAVFFKIVNTCSIPPKTDKDGSFLSSKRESGHGIGLSSVKKIAERYGGMMKATYEDGRFTVSVLLNIPE